MKSDISYATKRKRKTRQNIPWFKRGTKTGPSENKSLWVLTNLEGRKCGKFLRHATKSVPGDILSSSHEICSDALQKLISRGLGGWRERNVRKVRYASKPI